MTNKCTLILLTYFYCIIITNSFQQVECDSRTLHCNHFLVNQEITLKMAKWLAEILICWGW